MNKKFLALLLVLALVGCSNSTNESVSEESSNTDSIESVESIESIESEESTESFESEESTESFDSESEEEVEEKNVQYYTSHPTSEPKINQQLHTFSVLGDIYDVWNYYRGDGVKVAVIDQNFRTTHEDFYYEDGTSKISEDSARIYKSGNNVITEVGISKAGIDPSSNWHGTMCAGLLGAANNNKGTTGVAPNCDLQLIKVDNSPQAISEAFRYAADNGAKVISISLGNYHSPGGMSYGDIVYPAGFDLKTAFNEDINYAYSKGCTIVSAVGNDGKTALTYPAGCENVIGAGGLNAGSFDTLWSSGYEGTNYNGSTKYVDVYAPSDGIFTPGGQSDSGYMDSPTAKGTSFSAPIIAGAAALYFQKYPNATNVDFENALKSTCRNISSANPGKDTGYGAIDIAKLLNLKEDIKKTIYSPSGSVSQETTKLTINDNSSWLFRTLHLWNFEFEVGYGYKDLEVYFTKNYGEKISTSGYSPESNSNAWATTDEGFMGDYYLRRSSSSTVYEYVFPWWVKNFSFQVVNNSNWLPENGGYTLKTIGGLRKNVNVYINNGSTSYSISGVSKSNVDSIKVSFVGSTSISSETSSVFDYYVPSNTNYKFYLDSSLTKPYYRQILTTDTTLYF